MTPRALRDCPDCGPQTIPPYVSVKPFRDRFRAWVTCPACGRKTAMMHGATREEAVQRARDRWALEAVPNVD